MVFNAEALRAQRLVATKDTKNTKMIFGDGGFFISRRDAESAERFLSWGFAPDPKCELIVRE